MMFTDGLDPNEVEWVRKVRPEGSLGPGRERHVLSKRRTLPTSLADGIAVAAGVFFVSSVHYEQVYHLSGGLITSYYP